MILLRGRASEARGYNRGSCKRLLGSVRLDERTKKKGEVQKDWNI